MSSSVYGIATEYNDGIRWTAVQALGHDVPAPHPRYTVRPGKVLDGHCIACNEDCLISFNSLLSRVCPLRRDLRELQRQGFQARDGLHV